MNRDLPCLYSTPVDSPERLPSLPQHSSSSRLNKVFTYVAQEVTQLLQQSDHFPVHCNNKPVETIAIRALKPEYKFIIAFDPLTVRELQVLQLIVEGYSNLAIALKLYIRVGTVKSHVRNVLKKLRVRDRTQAAIRALRSGLVH
jgi:DNA-binding NarL/FixJ family response regulator